MLVRFVCILILTAGVIGCGGDRSGGREEILFWHVFTGNYGEYLDETVEEFNESHEGIKVRAQSMLGYNQIYRKTRLALMSGRLPDVAVAMESMVAEYYPHDVLVDIDSLSSKEELSDYFAPAIATNRYEEYNGRLLSFPFTKSLLMMYTNMDLLRKAGYSRPPATWDEFLEQARAIKKKLGITPYALSLDASTVDAIVLSFGGRIYDHTKQRSVFSEPAGLKTFRLIKQLAEEKLAHRINYHSRNDRIRFLRQEAVFVIRSSTSRSHLLGRIAGDFDWEMTIIPHGKDAKPATVLFGANVCIFKSNPEKEKAAWTFIKFLTSKDVTARWGTITGYMPVRKSAVNTERFKIFLGEAKQNKAAVSNMKYARFEPNVTGWQEMRLNIEKAECDVFEGRMTPEEAVRWLDDASGKLVSSLKK